MINKFLNKFSVKQQGVTALIIGLLFLLFSLSKLGTLIIHSLTIVIGLLLVYWGLEKTDLIKLFNKKTKR